MEKIHYFSCNGVRSKQRRLFARKRICIKTKHEDNILEKFKIIVNEKVFVIRAKELSAWSPSFVEVPEMVYSSEDGSVQGEGEKQTELGQKMNSKEEEREYIDKDGGNNADSVIQPVDKETSHDPFNIYDILNKQKKDAEVNGSDSNIPFPPGFTPIQSNPKAAEQETKMDTITDMEVKYLWGNLNFDFIFSEALGFSGGILCVWDNNMFRKEHHIIYDNFVALYRTWSSNKMKILLISVYAPHAGSYKRIMIDGAWVDDLREVKNEFRDHFASRFQDPGFCPVGPDSCMAVEWFFDNAFFPIGCNSSFIALIPKSLDPKVDFLDDVLCSFGFGSKWRMWISGCLRSSMASILVNGSPTTVFQFYRGLKQGDPSAPYLFIFVMESLHLSFSRVINAGIFSCVRIDPMTTIFHLFYADDAVFIGEWSQENLRGIMQTLRCFSLMYGLSINIKKSHLLGVRVSPQFVNDAANMLGCSVMRAPFNMSSYKVPKFVLNVMESIRRNFFNGVQDGERKIAWVKWAKVLVSKDHGGLGVSGYFALNKALLLKWVWRVLSHDNSLWFQIIYAIHGSQDQGLSVACPSNWSFIVKEVKALSTQGIDIFSHCKIKVGNGRSTSFWKDLWIGDTRICHKFPRLFALDVSKEGTVVTMLSAPLSSFFSSCS
uniref:RNA-directed DNA polymerase, eukaryota n=1 Tax=Tanacetum cinerariifolium TaxID=118510 RepID=A0A6L2LQR0_TANCI|nr:RNA-directed DNA polymerase, eukaryota [Tanacetum cinerariifolium]